MTDDDKISYCRDSRFDMQLAPALLRELEFGSILGNGKIELKTELSWWEQTGNICVEYLCDDKPSGISVTQADVWVQEIRKDDKTLVYLMFPIARLKELARQAIKAGRCKKLGDDKRFTAALIPLSEILK